MPKFTDRFQKVSPEIEDAQNRAYTLNLLISSLNEAKKALNNPNLPAERRSRLETQVATLSAKITALRN